ncbi:MAG: translocation/assembly module TamB domain-containing protein, partial [Deferrisomatales bacterium]
PRGRLEYATGLWFDTDVEVRALELVRRYVPPEFDARGRARGRFGGPYGALEFRYELDLASTVVLGQDLGRLRGEARYDLHDLAVTGGDLAGPLGRVRFDGRARLRPGGTYDLRLDWTRGDLGQVAAWLSRWVPPDLPGAVGGEASARGRLTGPLAAPAFDGQVSLAGPSVGRYRVEHADLDGVGSPAGWTLRAGRLRAYGAQVTASGLGDRERMELAVAVSGLGVAGIAEALGRPLPAEGVFGGTARLAGPYRALEGSAEGDLAGAAVLGRRLGALRVGATLADRRVRVRASGFEGRVEARGDLALTDGRKFQAELDVRELAWSALPALRLPPGLGARSLSGRGRVEGTLAGEEPVWAAQAEARVEGARWEGLDLGRVDLEAERRAGGWSFAAGGWAGEVRLRGMAAEQPGAPLELEATVDRLPVSRLPGLGGLSAGRLSAQARALVSLEEWAQREGLERLGAVAELSGEGRAWGLEAGGLRLPEWALRLGSRDGRPWLRVSSRGLEAEAEVEGLAPLTWRAGARLDGFEPGPLLPPDSPLHGLAGRVSGSLEARGAGGSVAEARGEGRLAGLAWGTVAPTEWSWTGRWRDGEGSVEAREPRGVEARVRRLPDGVLTLEADLRDVPLEGWVRGPAVPADLTGVARGAGAARWAPGERPTGRLTLDRLTLSLPPVDLRAPAPVALRYDGREVRVDSFSLIGQGLEASAQGAVVPGTSWDLDVTARADLGALRRWVPGVRALSGTARADLEVRGPWLGPRLGGPLEVEPGASLAFDRAGLAIEDLEASAFLDASRGLIIDWIDGQVGRGRLHVEGTVALDGVRPAGMRLYTELRDIAYEWPAGVSYAFDADLLVTGTPAAPEVRGEVRLEEFLYAKRLNWKSMILGLLKGRSRDVKSRPERGVFVDLSARGAEGLRIDNNLAQLSLAVELRARGYLPQPALWGRVETTEGTVRFRSLEYEVLRSSVEFLGEAQPVPLLDLHARTTVRQYGVSVDVSGPLDDYRVALASSPPMPQTDLVALLTLGTTADEAGGQGVTAAEAASYLTGRLQDELESGVGGFLGLDQFHIDPAYSPSAQTTVPRVTVGKAITRALYARYSAAISGEAEQDLEVQYTLTPRLSLLGTWADQGTETRGSLGGEVRVRFTFR